MNAKAEVGSDRPKHGTHGTPSLQPVAVVGAGAVGGFFGAMLARAGHRVTLIARAAQVDAIARDGLRLERGGRVEVLRVTAGTDPAAVRSAALVLLAVKSTDTEAAALALAPHVDAGALVLSLQNGIDNAPILAARLPCAVAAAAVYVATAMPEPGWVKHLGRGDLVVGPYGAAAPAPGSRLQAVADLFAAAGVPVRLSADVRTELWAKLLVNCAYNAVSAIAQAPYARVASVAEVVALQRQVVHEVIAVASAEGVALPLEASLDAVARLAEAMPAQHSSTAQDLARRRPSEIDHLNGAVVRRAAAHGIPAPANQALLALVKLIEAGT